MTRILDQGPNKKIYLIIFVISFIFYGNTISNEYALDDSIVITENSFTRQGFEGIDEILKNDSFTGFFGKQKKLVSGGRYRPLSIVTFAIEYEFFGKNPHVSHFINVLLYGLTGLIIYLIFIKLFWYYDNRPWYLSLAFLTAIFFLAHPIHTEAVANIKGRDEILSFLFALLTLKESINYISKSRIKYLILAFIYFFLALLSKENAITFLAVIPLTIYFFRNTASSKGNKDIFVTIIPPVVATILYLVIRYNVLGFLSTEPPKELMNNPFLHATVSEKYGTILYTLGLYLKLLFYPHPLTFDYYPYHIELVQITNIKAIISLLLYVGLIVLAIFKLKDKTIVSYSILYFLITLSIVSNLFFPVGTFMNERFLYMPSLGFHIFLAYLVSHYLFNVFRPASFRPLMTMLFVLGILVFSGFKIIRRNQDWKNNFTLFTNDVIVSSNSAKSNTSAGGIYIEQAAELENQDKKNEYYRKAINHLNKAIEIYPQYNDALMLLGNAHYHYKKNIDSTLKYYSRILKNNPHYSGVIKNLKAILGDQDISIDKKIKICHTVLKYRPSNYYFNYKLGKLYAQHEINLGKGLKYLEKAVKIKPNSIEALKDLGVAYGLQKNYSKSVEIFNKAIQLEPDDPQLYINQGINFRQMGQPDKAGYYFKKARELQREQND
jgi:tetratricopeptide (TPR) repeat protein